MKMLIEFDAIWSLSLHFNKISTKLVIVGDPYVGKSKI